MGELQAIVGIMPAYVIVGTQLRGCTQVVSVELSRESDKAMVVLTMLGALAVKGASMLIALDAMMGAQRFPIAAQWRSLGWRRWVALGIFATALGGVAVIHAALRDTD